MSTTTIITCDYCKRQITDHATHIDAGVYGKDLHRSCILRMTAAELVIILNLDDIGINGEKLPSFMKRRGKLSSPVSGK